MSPLTSPYFSQGNGEAECAVGTIKNLLKKEGDPYLALLACYSTPLEIGYIPTQFLMNRALCTTVPTTQEQRNPRFKTRQKNTFDKHHGARDLPPLKTGQLVWLQEANVTTLQILGNKLLLDPTQ